MENQLTKQDVFEIVNQVVTQVVERNNEVLLESINQSFTDIELRFQGIDRRFEQIDKRFEQIDKRFDKVDEQLSATRGDLTAAVRKTDFKIITLTNKLGARKVLPAADVSEVLALEPFPKTV